MIVSACLRQQLIRVNASILQVMCWAPGGVLSAYPSSFLHGKAAASGWAVVNAVGALMGGAPPLWPSKSSQTAPYVGVLD